MRGRHSHEILVACAAALVLLAHLALARPALEDIDSFNFALGIRDYDVARHQPHPPGYPVLILAARGTTWLSQTLRPAPESPEAAGLILLAAVACAIAVVAGRRVLMEAGYGTRVASAAAVLFACAPLPWITAERPLSDMPGLAAGLVGQWLLLRTAAETSWGRLAFAGLWVGLATGVRSQVLWLTLPLAAFVVVRRLRARSAGGALVLSGGLLAGVLLWLAPMALLSGGLDDYVDALEDQADDDFEGVPMLATQFSPRRLATALLETFVQPWALWPVAAAVLGSAAGGVVVLATRAPRVLVSLALLWLPYAVFHLLFQETETTRYALPLVLPVCALGATVLDMGRSPTLRRATAAAVIVIAGVLLSVSLRASWQFRVEPERVGDARQALAHAAAVRPPDVVLMHRRVWAETRRARGVAPWPGTGEAVVPTSHEWMGILPRLDRARVQSWWLVDPRRGDRVAIDPRSAMPRERFAWPMPLAPLLGGLRPHPFEWLVIDDPSWVLHDGWALTPELAGLSDAAGRGPGFRDGAVATVRTHESARTLMIGGRFVEDGARAVTMSVSVGDVWQATTEVSPGAFHRTWTVPPATAVASHHSETLTVSAVGPGSSALLLEQFDIQPAGVPVVALADGWYEPERDVTSGRRWRWMADRARLDVLGARCDLRVTVAGTWPRHYGDAPALSVRAGDRPLLETRALARPFVVTIDVPRASIDAAGRVALDLSVNRSFVAGARTGSADARRLALEVTDLAIAPLDRDDDCTPDVDSVTHESVRFRRQVTRGQ